VIRPERKLGRKTHENIDGAACGLNCETCEIRLAPFDQGVAVTVLNWFKSQGWLAENEGMPEVLERKMICTGCLGNRETHSLTDCWN